MKVAMEMNQRLKAFIFGGLFFSILSISPGELLGQDTWSVHINKLDSLEETELEYGKTVVHVSWQIVYLSPDTAMYYADLAYAFAEKYHHDSIRYRALMGRSTANSRMGNHTESIEQALEALKLAEEGLDTATMYDAATNLAIDKFYLDDKIESLKYFKQAAGYIENYRLDSRKSRNRYASSLLNVAQVEDALGYAEQVIKTYYQALKLFIEIDNRRSAAATQFNMATAYQKLNKYDSAEKYYNESLINYRTHVQTSAESEVLTNWADMCVEQGKFQKALELLYASLQLAKETNNKLQTQYAYGAMSEAFAGLGRYDSAYYYQGLSQEMLNKSRELEKQEYSDELLAKYETEKKEQQIANLEQENQIKELESGRQKLMIAFSLAGAVLLAIAIGLLYVRYRDKNRINTLLDAKNQELAKLNATKDRLFSIISHDLRSPLSSFQTITRSLSDNWETLDKDQLKEFIITLRDSSSDLKNMMDNLLKWALSQSQQLNYNPTSIRSEEVLRGVVKELGGITSVKNIPINVESKSLAEIQADKDFLQIIIRNLLSNALKFSEMESKIDVIVEEQENKQIISIQDYGVGMDQSEVDKLFAGEIVAHDIQNSTEKGTGLGLALCKELMGKMDAQMEASSEKGKGTIFRLIFPVAA